eukprot:CAMPEP_0168524022 /NCGR_PEP_ID=MMETSP0405-20121227/10380_1 /TAXON_ID=498012 /ORGANISM="Trichosphaerium sp, Strain Am-I-7 wt" /LENGTH=129 /DNA_ID=CAMNT_0008546105 /DNA_START=998 /DNA_END=1387 /DNA_ORIENTATION=-
MTLSLESIAATCKLDGGITEVKMRLVKMIEKGQIFATINEKDGMVSFHDNPEQYNSNSTLNHLRSQLDTAVELTKRLKSVDEDISTSEKYVQKNMQSERGAGPGRGNYEFDDMDVGGDSRFGGPSGFRA